MADTLFALLSFEGPDQYSHAGGLEVMAAGGLAITGSTGEDYAEPFRNALVLETDDPAELVACLNLLQADPRVGPRLRRARKATARDYLWDKVIRQLFARLELAASRQGVRLGADT